MQPVVAERVKQGRRVEGDDWEGGRSACACRGADGARLPGAQRPGAHRPLKPLPFLLKRAQASGRGCLVAAASRPDEAAWPAWSLTSRSAARSACKRLVGRRPDRGNGERDGPPALAPFEHQPGPPETRRVPQAERGQFGAVRRGLRAQLRRAEHGAELVDDRQAPAAGLHQAARIAGRPPRGAPARATRRPGTAPGRGAGSGRRGGKVLAPPRRGAARRRRWPRSPRPRRSSRWSAAARARGDAAGGQPRERQLGRAEAVSSRTHRRASPSSAAVAGPGLGGGAHPGKLGVRAPPPPALPAEQPGRLRGPVLAVAGSPAASAQLAATSSSSARMVGWPRTRASRLIAASASRTASAARPAAISAAHRWALRSASWTPSAVNRSSAASKQASASGSWPVRKAAVPGSRWRPRTQAPGRSRRTVPRLAAGRRLPAGPSPAPAGKGRDARARAPPRSGHRPPAAPGSRCSGRPGPRGSRRGAAGRPPRRSRHPAAQQPGGPEDRLIQRVPAGPGAPGEDRARCRASRARPPHGRPSRRGGASRRAVRSSATAASMSPNSRSTMPMT